MHRIHPDHSPAIETAGLSKHFGRRRAVDDLTIAIPAGTIAGFIGPNGSGKTTAIRLLLGLVRPTAGGATVLGRPVTDPRSYLPSVGALVEAPAFYPSLSARTNLEVLARLAGCSRDRVDVVLELVELSDRARDRVGTYSLGMKQRLGLAMALLPDPDLLILDEPANGLDPPGIIATRDLLRRLRDEGKTVFLSSHLLGELEQVADWLVMIHQGRSLYSGPARAFLEQQSMLVVKAGDAAHLDVLAGVARAAGYTATVDHDTLAIGAPLDFSAELRRRAGSAGIVDLTIRARETTFEERFMALLQGEHR